MIVPLRARLVRDHDAPERAAAFSPQHLGVRFDGGAAGGGVHGVENHEVRILDPAVGIFEPPPELRLERFAGRILRQVHPPRRRQKLAAAKVVVEKEAEPDKPGRPKSPVVREDEPQGPDDVRRGAEQHFALHQRLANQPKLVIFEVAQAAVDELGRSRRGPASQVRFLGEIDGKATAGRIAGDAAAVDAPANDGDVEGRCAHLPSPLRRSINLSLRT